MIEDPALIAFGRRCIDDISRSAAHQRKADRFLVVRPRVWDAIIAATLEMCWPMALEQIKQTPHEMPAFGITTFSGAQTVCTFRAGAPDWEWRDSLTP